MLRTEQPTAAAFLAYLFAVGGYAEINQRGRMVLGGHGVGSGGAGAKSLNVTLPFVTAMIFLAVSALGLVLPSAIRQMVDGSKSCSLAQA